MGVPIGVGVSLLLAGWLGPTLGWRNSFLTLGAIGVALSLLMLTRRDGRRVTPSKQGAERLRAGDLPHQLFGALRQSPALLFTIAGGVAVHFVLGAAAFDQLWLVQERGFERSDIALISGVLACIFGVAGNLFGGIAGDLWRQRTGQSRTNLVFWLLIVLSPLTLAYRLAPAEHPLFWIGMASGFFLLGSFFGPTFASVQELCPARIRSTVVATFIMAMNVVGLGVGVTGSGFLVDALAARGVDQPYTWTLFTFACLSLTAIPLFYFAAKTAPEGATSHPIGQPAA